MRYFSINLVVAGDEEDALERVERCLTAIDMVLSTNGFGSELVMLTAVDKAWVDSVHAQLDEADEEEN